jgi:hypothetical protein
MKRNLLGVILVVVGFSVTAMGQSEGQKFNGHLVDAVCAGNHATEPGYAANHEKQCNLMAGCVKSGFSLITADSKVLKFDQKGNDQALALIKAYDKEKDMKVTVVGKLDGQTLTVSSIKLN